ncbi:MAG: type I-U CRISPR-associated protein Cas7, partial [Candidatus Rokubacteria bacterium]|nr:type I-U CRISPR-associated protein Cas7 [Candidatus Rokubacteria bacterium]
ILDQMYAKDRVIIRAQLNLANGHFLQPTGFPDIGSCVYAGGDGKKRCLVESEQSMANRLEAVGMKAPGHWVDELAWLPVIEVGDSNGTLLATNLTEPHRIASSYVLEGKLNGSDLKTMLADKVGLADGGAIWPLDKREALEKLVFALDPAALLHGFQFVQWKFVGLRQTRLLSARLECVLAEEAEVHYGMVKFDLIDPSGQGAGTNKGQSIAAKSRIVAAKGGIEATFDIDILGLKSVALEDNKKKLLLALALWKIGAFLLNKPAFDARSRQTSPALRLRADCYLSCGDSIEWSAPPENGTSIKPSELVAAIAGQRMAFDKLAAAQGFEFKRESDGKLLPLRVVYTKSARAQPAASTSAPEEPQAGDAQPPGN